MRRLRVFPPCVATVPSTTSFHPAPEGRLPIRVLAAVNRLLTRAYHKLEVRHRPIIPARGAAILVCNHVSGLDPLLIQSTMNRVIVWMMAKEFYDIAALTPVFRIIEAIPVARSGRDMGATRAAMRALHGGRVVGIFPEGRIERSRELLPFQTGVAMMAIKTGVPVFPAYLDGTQRSKTMRSAFLGRQEATLSFGPEVQFDRSSTDRESLDRATQAIQQAVETLRQAEEIRRRRHL